MPLVLPDDLRNCQVVRFAQREKLIAACKGHRWFTPLGVCCFGGRTAVLGLLHCSTQRQRNWLPFLRIVTSTRRIGCCPVRLLVIDVLSADLKRARGDYEPSSDAEVRIDGKKVSLIVIDLEQHPVRVLWQDLVPAPTDIVLQIKGDLVLSTE